MLIHKIAMYERDHGKGSFFWYRTLPIQECMALAGEMKRRLKLPDDASPLALIRAIGSQATPIDGVNALGEHFRLGVLLRELGLDLPDTLYVDWYRFDQMDEMRTPDISIALDDIWYPGAEDIAIVDPKLRWIVPIDHDGYLGLVRTDALS